MAKSSKLLLRSPVFRMSFPNLDSPRPYVNPKTGARGEPEYNVEMLLVPDDLDRFQVRRDDAWEDINVKVAMVEVAKAAWPDINVKEAVAQGGLSWPLKSGEKKNAEREARGKKSSDAYEGVVTIPIKAKQAYPPQLYVIEAGKFRELNRDDDADTQRIRQLFVGGHYAKANLNICAVNVAERKYIVFYVNAVVFAREGERIGGMSAEERFGGIEGGEADVDPLDDDEIPF